MRERSDRGRERGGIEEGERREMGERKRGGKKEGR